MGITTIKKEQPKKCPIKPFLQESLTLKVQFQDRGRHHEVHSIN